MQAEGRKLFAHACEYSPFILGALNRHWPLDTKTNVAGAGGASTHGGGDDGQRLLVVVPGLVQQAGLHLGCAAGQGELDEAVDALAEEET